MAEAKWANSTAPENQRLHDEKIAALKFTAKTEKCGGRRRITNRNNLQLAFFEGH
jgi:hypothetical protein